MSKLIWILLASMTMFTLVLAEEEVSIGIVTQGTSIQLTQVCDNCTYINITQVLYPNQSIAFLGQRAMTKNGSNYNSTWTDTNTQGSYYYTTCGDLDGINTCQSVKFEVTPSGTHDSSFYLIILGISAVIIGFGFLIKDGWIVVFGTFGLYFVGIYTLRFGFAGIRNLTYTYAIAIIILGLAGYLSIKSGWEMIGDD